MATLSVPKYKSPSSKCAWHPFINLQCMLVYFKEKLVDGGLNLYPVILLGVCRI